MASCAHCGSVIVFGGKRYGDLRFCNNTCYEKGMQDSGILAAVDEIPEEFLWSHIEQVHSGNCPKCLGPGPVDVHTSYRIWSALVVTSWNSRPCICCRSCGIKSKIGDTFFCLLLGWWGFPWGLLMTPFYLGKNLWGICFSPDGSRPSPQLETTLRLDLAYTLAQARQEEQEVDQ